MTWFPVDITFTTPAFIGGPDQAPEFRIPALRGLLREWFRALAGPHLPDPVALASLEREVFGGVHGGDAVASTVRIRPHGELPKGRSEATPAWLTKDLGYLLGQGAYHPGGRNRSPQVTRGFLPADTTVSLGFFVPDELRQPIAATLWFASSFGSLGSRARKGFGSFVIERTQLEDLAGDVVPPVDGLTVRQRITAQHYVAAERFGSWLPQRSGQSEDPKLPTPFPQVGFSTTDGNGQPAPHTFLPLVMGGDLEGSAIHRSALDALASAGHTLRAARAPVDRGEELRPHERWVTREYRDFVMDRSSEARVTTAHVAGLPVKLGNEELNIARDGKKTRRPSVVRLRPWRVGESESEWAPVALVFFAKTVPEGARLELGHRPVEPQQGDLEAIQAFATDLLAPPVEPT